MTGTCFRTRTDQGMVRGNEWERGKQDAPSVLGADDGKGDTRRGCVAQLRQVRRSDRHVQLGVAAVDGNSQLPRRVCPLGTNAAECAGTVAIHSGDGGLRCGKRAWWRRGGSVTGDEGQGLL